MIVQASNSLRKAAMSIDDDLSRSLLGLRDDMPEWLETELAIGEIIFLQSVDYVELPDAIRDELRILKY